MRHRRLPPDVFRESENSGQRLADRPHPGTPRGCLHPEVWCCET